MNSIECRLHFGALPDLPVPQLAVELLLDGQSPVVWSEIPVNILALLASADKPGTYFIWTCTCGFPECVGMGEGVKVAHGEATISWLVSEVPFEQPTRFEFDKQAYRDVAHNAWKEYVSTYQAYRAARIDFELCPAYDYMASSVEDAILAVIQHRKAQTL